MFVCKQKMVSNIDDIIRFGKWTMRNELLQYHCNLMHYNKIKNLYLEILFKYYEWTYT